ncbi:DUF4294 domain-containing protein [Microbacter margulisiae]|uniref:DUF4294 domain-containing protein n=1 Tax=Microbacter margulisiae TaxID=1350067 RepID=A0A7W5DQF5_9PORP|nr:DUF4294 domain-containing protein [Microbacter margulisiae]MBB3186684.1 hypothetical protein [Microbacter margulisiae]
MKKILVILLPFIMVSAYGQQTNYDQWLNDLQRKQQIYNDLCYTLHLPSKSKVCAYEIDGKDTLFLYTMNDVYCFPPLKFKNKREERFYWKTVYDVKRVLPYARMASRLLLTVDQHLATLQTEQEKKAYIKQVQKTLFKQYDKDLRSMTINQGKLLVRMIDRECNQTAYSIIQEFKGPVTAWFWQGIAKLFGSNLKAQYDPENRDRIIERVIILVEAGEL